MRRPRDGKVAVVNCLDSLRLPPSRLAWPVSGLTAESLLALHAANPQRYPVLLQSVVTPLAAQGYDVLMAFPEERLTLTGNGAVRRNGVVTASRNGFLPALDEWWRTLRQQSDDVRVGDLPFTGGWFLYLAYELAGAIEPRLKLHAPADGCIAEALRIPVALLRNTATGDGHVVAEPEYKDRAEQLLRDTQTLRTAAPSGGELPIMAEIAEDAPQKYLDAVQRALEYIAAGDIYQANLSRAWHARIPPQVTAAQLYRSLCRSNPAPFAGIAVLQEGTILSSSPERLLEVRNGWANTRPIAGTRPRSANEVQDRALLRELRAHPKEQAEHVMLLDLERNDLGRICQGGTVKVDEYMGVESYAHVHHLVSSVRGKLRADVTPGQAIAAVFPGGTITGCPKVRCMEIIAELEQAPRGAYTGSMGYLNRDGSMDLNILIRTLILQNGTAMFRAGAGIVADSLPQRELEETRAKALGMIRAFAPDLRM